MADIEREIEDHEEVMAAWDESMGLTGVEPEYGGVNPTSARGRMPAPSSSPNSRSGGDSVTPHNENLGGTQSVPCGGES